MFWRLKVQDQDTSLVGFWGEASSRSQTATFVFPSHGRKRPRELFGVSL